MVAEPGGDPTRPWASKALIEMEKLMIKVIGEIDLATPTTKAMETYPMVKQISTAVMGLGSIIMQHQKTLTEHQQAVVQQNAAIVAAVSRVGNSSSNRKKAISEHKAIQNLKVYESDKLQFTNWNDKLINALGQVHPQMSECLKQINLEWSQTPEEIVDLNKLNDIYTTKTVNMTEQVPIEKFNDDMHYVLVEKTAGEAANKVKGVEPGNGLLAYYRIYWWFTKTSGTALQDRSRKALYPNAIVKDEKLMESLEEWEASVKILDQHGSAYMLNAQAKLNALEVLMGQKQSVYESIERAIGVTEPEEKFKQMMAKLREYAAKKRWDHQYKKGTGDPMDIGELQKELNRLQELESANWDIDAIGKGKAKGGFKGYGKWMTQAYSGSKGQGKSVCYNCLEEGHTAVNCPKERLCNNCLKPGHFGYQCTNPMHPKVQQFKQQKGKAKGNSKGKANWKGKGKGVYEIDAEGEWNDPEWNLHGGEEEEEVTLGKQIAEVQIGKPPGLDVRKKVEASQAIKVDHGLGKGPIKIGLWEVMNKPSVVNRQIDCLDYEKKENEKDSLAVNEIITTGNWEKIPVKLDSGAIGWVFTTEAGKAFPLEPTKASLAGVNYVAANGTTIGNYGQRKIKGYSDEKVPLAVAAQIADVKNNLGSVYRMCQAGNRVMFDEDGSYIENKKTGKKIKVKMENGAFEFDLWVSKAQKVPAKKVKVENRFKALEQEDVDDEMPDAVDDDDKMVDMVLRRRD